MEGFIFSAHSEQSRSTVNNRVQDSYGSTGVVLHSEIFLKQGLLEKCTENEIVLLKLAMYNPIWVSTVKEKANTILTAKFNELFTKFNNYIKSLLSPSLSLTVSN